MQFKESESEEEEIWLTKCLNSLSGGVEQRAQSLRITAANNLFEWWKRVQPNYLPEPPTDKRAGGKGKGQHGSKDKGRRHREQKRYLTS